MKAAVKENTNLVTYDIPLSVMITYISQEPEHFLFNAKGDKYQIILDICTIIGNSPPKLNNISKIEKISICSQDNHFRRHCCDLGDKVLETLRTRYVPEDLRNWIKTYMAQLDELVILLAQYQQQR